MEQPGAVTESTERGSGIIDLICERGILAVVLLALVYSVLAWGGVRTQDFVYVEALTILGLVLWLGRIWFRRGFRLLWPPISWVVVAFVIYAVARCATDNLHYPARQELSRIFVLASIFFLASNNLTRRNSATVVSMTLVCVGLAVSVMAIYQFSTHNGWIWGWYKPTIYLARASGTFINPNHLAGFLEMIVPLAIAYMFMGRLPVTVKVLLGYCTLMMITAICMSLSRAGILVTGITLAAIFVALLFQRDFWLKSAVALFLFSILIAGAFTQVDAIERRFGKLINQQSGNIEDARVRVWDAAQNIYREQPIFGPGPGHFDYEFRKYSPKFFQERAQFVHNDYLNALCDWGAVGLLIALGSCALLFSGALKTWPFVRKQPNEIGRMRSNKGAFVFGAAFSVLAILLHSFTDFNLHIPSNALLLAVLAGLLTAHWRFATEGHWRNPRLLGKVALTLGIAAVAGYGIQQAAKDLNESQWLDRAQKIETYTDEKKSALMHAWENAPDNYQTAYEIGECLRLQAWRGLPGNEQSAKEAIQWFDRAIALDPYDPYSPMRKGMCLDWLDQHVEAAKYFEKARQLAPNDHFVWLFSGWHEMQVSNWKEAKRMLHYAAGFYHTEAVDAYIEMVDRRMNEPSLLKY